jgi:2-amino-4-hydroxy-6-hydroxymethyldihydropteridine diphosphokinase
MPNGFAADIQGIICFIGVGSNLDDPASRCVEAVRRVSAVHGIKFLRRSSLYRTEPVGFIEQEWFVNAVIEIRTVLSPRELLNALRAVEDCMGRVRGPKWGPRIIDLDILLYGQEIIQDDTLVVPHPELHKRRFVLAPLCELASYVIHPAFGISIRGLMDRVNDESRVRIHDVKGRLCLI